MFTGIIEEVGTITVGAPRLSIACSVVLDNLILGGSIAVNGVCLTAAEVTPKGFSADLAPETLARTNLGALRPGDLVNLERPVTPNTLLSGHIVQGHVDGTGEVLSFAQIERGNWWLDVRVPTDLQRYMVEKGSITLNGISLTIARISQDVVSVAIIPHTLEHTNLSRAVKGTTLNIEADVLEIGRAHV